MRKLVIILILVASFHFANSQKYTATIAIDKVDVSSIKPGDEVVVPVRLVEKSGGLVSELQFFIEFDHSIFKWNGSFEEASSGIRNCHKNMPYSPKTWMLNDNGNQLVCLWSDPTFAGVQMENGDAFCEYVFIYQGGMTADKTYSFSWGSNYEDVGGKLVRGVTELYSEIPDFFTLTKIDGFVTH